MCTNIREIRNKYTGQTLYKECGKCPACLQKKADARSNKIRSNNIPGYVCMFFHLTYSDDYIPYIYIEDLKLNSDGDVNVYVDRSTRYVYNKRLKSSVKKTVIKTKCVDVYHYKDCRLDELKRLYEFKPGKVGVLNYSDIQKFFKRLRNNLNRNEKYRGLVSGNESIKYFVAGEYGAHKTNHQRPHYHVLMWVPSHSKSAFSLWQSLVVECWPFATEYVTKRRFEYAINAASYASQYVNCSEDISKFLQRDDFRPFWHYSQSFGVGLDSFSVKEILSSIESNDFRYHVSYVRKDKTLATSDVPYPKYIRDRFFPSFKGRYKLSYDDLRGFITNCLEFSQYTQSRDIYDYLKLYGSSVVTSNTDINLSLFWSWFTKIQYICDMDYNEVFSTIKHLHTCFYRIRHELRNFSISEYAHYYVRCLQLSTLNCMRSQYEFKEFRPYRIFQKYFNILKVLNSDNFYLLDSFGYWIEKYDCDYIVDSNSFIDVIDQDSALTKRFYNNIKQRQTNSLIYAENFK